MKCTGWVFVFLFVLVPRPAQAVLPPDLIFSVGSTFVQLFSILALVVTGVVTSVVMVGRHWLLLSMRHIWKIIAGGVLMLLLVTAWLWHSSQDSVVADLQREIQQLTAKNELLENAQKQSVSADQYNQLLLRLQSLTDDPIEHLLATTTEVSGLRHFASDTITLFSPVDTTPFVLEIDLNRRQDPNGLYSHYTFLHGSWRGDEFSDYDLVYASTSVPKPNAFLNTFVRTRAVDLSTRDTYEFEVEVLGDLMQVVVRDVEGDFLTRNHPNYTRYQSVTQAEVLFRGERFSAQALVESSFAEDYTEYVFFPEYNEVDATTHQFILWDAENNFYMIDQSDVRSNTPAYPSHKWLLFKDMNEGIMQKSFSSDIEKREYTYIVTADDFKQARFVLDEKIVFKGAGSDRSRSTVSGTVTDADGVRAVNGILHLVQ